MKQSLDLVFLWHMHQPDYRDTATGDFLLPWVYLHAIKDYSDMAYHLEQHPTIKAVVNFVPVLLDQLEDYERHFASGQIRDPLLRLLARENLSDLSSAERELILESCFRSNHHKMVAPYPAYKRLFDLFKMLELEGSVALAYLSGQYLADLLTWYHLVWCGESLRREHDLIIRLMSKDENFTPTDRKNLFDLIGQTLKDIIPRYRRLAESGQIEISTTPHYHPLAPLLLDFNSALESSAGSSLPQAPSYPGGKSRVQAHIAAAVASHQARFGMAPQGIWPAEGAISTVLLQQLAENNCHWTASGQAVLVNSLRSSGQPCDHRSQYLYRPYRLQGNAGSVRCFFRDDLLSDSIGFEYSGWNGYDAAQHFVAQLETIAKQAPSNETPVVSIILDGENAWEYYPYNGYHFLNDLYSLLEHHPTILTTTYNHYLQQFDQAAQLSSLVQHELVVESSGLLQNTGMTLPDNSQARNDYPQHGELPQIVAGSWVYGTFSTWIGSPDKNRAWDLLCLAKQSFDRVMVSGQLSQAEAMLAERQLASCESSDWFWWFGDYNPSHAVAVFDQLFRLNLMRLYQLLKLPVPSALGNPISHGSGDPELGGAMRRSS